MPTSNQPAAFAVALLLLSSTVANADIILKFSGKIPTIRGSRHPMVQNGETWEASFRVDESVVDNDPNNQTSGEYLGTVVSGRLEFSGGFVSNFDFSGLTVYVANDSSSGYLRPRFDGVSVRSVDSVTPFISVLTEDSSTLDSDALPLPGTTFESNSDSDVFTYAFRYEDELGRIQYFWEWVETTDVHTFSVSNVPETATPLLGDANLDGATNFLDISPFILLLSTGGFLAEADCNQDGFVNFLDISPFITNLN